MSKLLMLFTYIIGLFVELHLLQKLGRFKQIRIFMLLFAAAFIAYALFHPETSFPWSNTITYTVYGFYLAVAVILLTVSV